MLHSLGLLLRMLILAVVLTWLPGCATPPKSLPTVHVHASAKGIVSCCGGQFGADQFPTRLAKSGVDKSQEIRVHMEDIRNAWLREQITAGLLREGYLRVLFVAAPMASSEVVGEPGSRAEAPARSHTPPSPAPKPVP